MEFKIATLNLCLGLKNKRIDVENLLIMNKIEILCLQEVEIEAGFNQESLNLKNFQLEIERNSLKSRCGIYIKKSIAYTRMYHLEGVDSHIVIIDLEVTGSINRVINVYRSFNPQNNVNARTKFRYQLGLIKSAWTQNCVIIGDFNLDYAKAFDTNYSNKYLFADFDEVLSELELIQLVKFETWSRMVGSVRRSSILDHIYVKDPMLVSNVNCVNPFFGDHVLVEFLVNVKKCKTNANICRDWRKYSKELLNVKLAEVDWNIQIDDVQEFWNAFESLLIKIVDEIVPLTEFNGNIINEMTPKLIKNKINKRNRWLKFFKKHPTVELKRKIADLNCEIRSHFFYKKKFSVRKGIIPGNSKSLWKAVKTAKNIGHSPIPSNMKVNNVPVTGQNIAEHFAEFFDNKVKRIVRDTVVDPLVFNSYDVFILVSS